MERVVKLDKDDVDLSKDISEYHHHGENDQGEDYGAYEPYMPSAREEILQLHRALRNQKNFMRMKEIMMKEKHEREIFNLKQQLTSNQCLWEQLAESEKREAIMRQELFFTQQSLATCEKIISKMQSQLEVLQNQRLRLQQYKNNKTKRLDELEGKVRQMEILENIDLNKLLDELRLRDRKLSQLTGIEKNLQGKMDAVYKVIYIKIYSFRSVSKKLTRCATNFYRRRR
jgi:chromosome segregation ATPase